LKATGHFDVQIDIPKAPNLRTGSVVWGVYVAAAGGGKPISNVVLCKMRVTSN